MVDYIRSRDTAHRIIAKYGQAGFIRRAGTDYPASIAVLDYDTKDIDGTRVKDGDRLIYVSALAGVAVKMGDVILDKALNPYTVVRRRSLSPAGVAVYYRVQGRGTQ